MKNDKSQRNVLLFYNDTFSLAFLYSMEDLYGVLFVDSKNKRYYRCYDIVNKAEKK